MVWFVSCSLHNRIWEGLTMVCSKNCKISSSECPRKQGDTNRSDFSFATLWKHGEKGVCLLPLNRYFSIEFRRNFYMCICRKGETFTMSIFENIGHQLLKLLPKNCGNRSDLSARPVPWVRYLWLNRTQAPAGIYSVLPSPYLALEELGGSHLQLKCWLELSLACCLSHWHR